MEGACAELIEHLREHHYVDMDGALLQASAHKLGMFAEPSASEGEGDLADLAPMGGSGQ